MGQAHKKLNKLTNEANNHLQQKNWKQAETSWKRYMIEKPDDVLGYHMTAKSILAQLEDRQLNNRENFRTLQVENLFKIAQEKNNKDAELYFDIGSFYSRANKCPQAEQYYLKALQLNTNHFKSIFNLALLYYYQKKINSAWQYCIKAQQIQKDNTKVTVLTALLEEECGRFDSAQQKFRNAVAISPKSKQAYFYLGSFLNSRKKFSQGLEACQKCLDIDQKDQQCYLQKGYSLIGLQKYKQAQQHYKQGAERFQSPQIQVCYALILQKFGQVREAQKYMKKSFGSVSFSNARISLRYYQFLIRNQKNEEANSLLQKLIINHPYNGQINRLYGLYLYKKGNKQQSEKYLKKTIELNPSDAYIYCIVAELLCNCSRQLESQFYFQKAKQLGFESNVFSFNYIKALKSINKIDKAIQIAEEDLKKYEKYQPLYKLLIELYQIQSKKSEINELYKKWIEISQNKDQACEDFAIWLERQENFYQCQQYYQKALQINPRQAYYYFNYGIFLQNQKKLLKAASILQQGFLQQQQFDICTKIARIQRQLKNNQQAEKYYLKAISLKNQEVSIHFDYANFIKKQKPDQATQHFIKAISLDKTPKSRVSFANFLRGIEKYSEAEYHYMRTLEDFPNHTNAMIGLARNYYFLGAFQKAQKILQKILDKDPDNSDACSFYATLLLTLQKDSQKAQKLFRKSIQKDVNPQLFNSFANFLDAIGATEQAQVMYRKALALDSQDVGLLVNLASFIHNSRNEIREAEELYEKALTLQNSASVFYSYGDFLRKRGMSSRSLQYLRKAHKLAPNDPFYLIHLATLQKQQGNEQEAHQSLLRAAQIIESQKEQKIMAKHDLGKSNIRFIRRVLSSSKILFSLSQTTVQLEDHDNQNVGRKNRLIALDERYFSLLNKTILSFVGNQRKKNVQLEGQLEKLKEDIKEQKNITQSIDKKNKQNSQEIIQMRSSIQKIKEEFWDTKFEEMLKMLKSKKNHRMEQYIRKLCWMLCSAIQGYRQISMGVVSVGQNAIRSQIGNYVHKFGKVCEIFANGIGLKDLFQVATTGIKFYCDKDQEIIVNQLVKVIGKYYSLNKKLEKSVTKGLLNLVENKSFVLLIQNPPKQSWYDSLKKQKNQIIQDSIGFLSRISIKDDEEESMRDYTIILKYLIANKTNDGEDPIVRAIASMMEQRLTKHKQHILIYQNLSSSLKFTKSYDISNSKSQNKSQDQEQEEEQSPPKKRRKCS